MRLKSEKLLLDVEEKDDSQSDDQTNEKILQQDNKDAKLCASAFAPEQDDLNNTERALRLDIKEKGEIELVDQEHTNIFSPAVSENFDRKAKGNTTSVLSSISDIDGEPQVPGPKPNNISNFNVAFAVASPTDISFHDPEKGAKPAKEDKKKA